MLHDIHSYLPPSKGASVSTQTIHNKLHEVWPRTWQLVTGILLSVQHRTACLDWCCRYHYWTNEWHNILIRQIPLLLTDEWWQRTYMPATRRCYLAVHVVECHTTLAPNNGLDRRESLCTFTVGQYFISFGYFSATFGTLFQQDNAQPHLAQWLFKSMDEFHMLSWPAALPDFYFMQHMWDLVWHALAHNIEELQ